MEGSTTTFDSRDCPNCGDTTTLTHIGGEPPREICGRFGCEWEGEALL